jgi:hypothetical protein
MTTLKKLKPRAASSLTRSCRNPASINYSNINLIIPNKQKDASSSKKASDQKTFDLQSHNTIDKQTSFKTKSESLKKIQNQNTSSAIPKMQRNSKMISKTYSAYLHESPDLVPSLSTVYQNTPSLYSVKTNGNSRNQKRETSKDSSTN